MFIKCWEWEFMAAINLRHADPDVVSVRSQRRHTERPVWSRTSFCWHWNKSCALVWEVYTVAELIISCQQTVFRDQNHQMDHPLVRGEQNNLLNNNSKNARHCHTRRNVRFHFLPSTLVSRTSLRMKFEKAVLCRFFMSSCWWCSLRPIAIYAP